MAELAKSCVTMGCEGIATHEADVYDGVNDEPIVALYCDECADILERGGDDVRPLAERIRDDIQPYDSDHTALVHVLWEARRRGWTLDDFDEVAALIMRSRWMEAVRLHASERPR